jgi:hypothetical protein
MTTDLTSHRLLITVLTGIGLALGVTTASLTRDVITGVIAAAGFIAVTIQMVRSWARHQGPPAAPRQDPGKQPHTATAPGEHDTPAGTRGRRGRTFGPRGSPGRVLGWHQLEAR